MKNRTDVNDLDKIPNVGPATIRYLNMLGINKPFELIGRNPYSMYGELCKIAGKKFDPCLADVFISAVKFMEAEVSHKSIMPPCAVVLSQENLRRIYVVLGKVYQNSHPLQLEQSIFGHRKRQSGCDLLQRAAGLAFS